MMYWSQFASLLAALVLGVLGSSASSADSDVDRLGGLLDVPEMKHTLAAIFKGETSQVLDDDSHRIFVYTILGGIFRVCGQQSGMLAYAARRYVEPALLARGFTGSLDEAIAKMSAREVRLSADRLGINAGEGIARWYGCDSDGLRAFDDNLGRVLTRGLRHRRGQ